MSMSIEADSVGLEVQASASLAAASSSHGTFTSRTTTGLGVDIASLSRRGSTTKRAISATTQASSTAPLPSTKSTVLEAVVPPTAFGIVEEGIYRSNAFESHNYAFVRGLKLCSIIYLSPELTRLAEFVRQSSIRFCHQGLKVWRPDVTWKPVSEELVKEALEFVLDVRNHPVMVMCSSGIHETGALVGCLRRLQCWNMASIVDEYRRFATPKARFAIEQFMELFDVDLITLPQDLPSWFVDHIRAMHHEQHRRSHHKENRRRLSGGSQSVDLRTSISAGHVLDHHIAPASLNRAASELTGKDDMFVQRFAPFISHLYDTRPAPLISTGVAYDVELSTVVDED